MVQLLIYEECRGSASSPDIGKQGGIYESYLSHLEKDGTFLKQKRFLNFPVFQDHRAQVKLSTARYKKSSLYLSPSAETRVVLFSVMFFLRWLVCYLSGIKLLLMIKTV